jgi:hypothetical protein
MRWAFTVTFRSHSTNFRGPCLRQSAAPFLGICLAEVHRRRSNREIYKRHIAGVAKAVQVAIRKPTPPAENGSVRSSLSSRDALLLARTLFMSVLTFASGQTNILLTSPSGSIRCVLISGFHSLMKSMKGGRVGALMAGPLHVSV